MQDVAQGDKGKMMPYPVYKALFDGIENFTELCKVRRTLEKMLLNKEIGTDKALMVPKRNKDESLEDWFKRCILIYNLGESQIE